MHRPTASASAPHLPVVPEGFEIEIVAAPPLVDYPTLACFDDEGRLYVSEGANVNDEYNILKETLPRSIRRLEDTDGDGKFDRSTVFADRMTFPYGGAFHNGALYVASDPSLWRLEDTDGDGVADKRDIIITGFEASGHAACMKGGYLGLDGYMYFCGGNETGVYNLVDKNGVRLKDTRTAPCIFRIRPDGTGLEYFANGGAGVYDLTFDASGDLFGVTTILRYPRGDGLMYWVYGGAYQSSRPISLYARLTGDVLPALKEWPQSSPSGAVL
jgi:putative membrane-bound dehydrogenase-like protein